MGLDFAVLQIVYIYLCWFCTTKLNCLQTQYVNMTSSFLIKLPTWKKNSILIPFWKTARKRTIGSPRF